MSLERVACMTKKKKGIVLFMLTAIALIGFASGCATAPEDPTNAKPPVEGEPGDSITINRNAVFRYVQESKSVWEFAQRLFIDTIVYKDKFGSFVFAPIDNSLPRSEYNWDYLKELGTVHREVEYVKSGKTLSIKGIDVSRYQKTIEWDKVAGDGVRFAFVRLGYRGYDKGKLVMDELFEENARGAAKNGVALGVYFVTQAVSVEEAIEEAEYVLDAIKPYNVSWPIVLDIEDAASQTARTVALSKAERTDHAIAFCETIQEAGYTPMLYSNIRWYMDELDLTRLTEYDKWFAQYFKRPFFPYAFQVWQYTDSGRVDGITGPVDLNISFVDYGERKESTE